MKDLKLHKTVYSWVMPETEAMIRKINKPEHQAILQERHREAWKSKQDAYHEEFFDTWLDWTSDYTTNFDALPFRYPTAGSSEAIRESLAQHASLASYRPHLGVPTIHVFAGEYEGYKALAKPYGIRVVEHDHGLWHKSLEEFCREESTEGHKFYISNPSSIDGKFWKEFHYFLDFIRDRTDMKVMLDLCYVGCVPKDYYPYDVVDGSHEAIDTVFFSLSKSFGVYYHRIGGMFSKTEHPGLWGNRWFKNLTSLYLGTQLMKRYGLTELPDKYRPLQEEIISELERLSLHHPEIACESEIQASHVFLLAGGHARYTNEFTRIGLTARYCLTERLYEKCMERGDYNVDPEE